MTRKPAKATRLVIQPEAEAEIREAFEWYEGRAKGLGAEFVRAVDACHSLMERNPTASAVVHKQVRRALVRRFSYGYLLPG